MTGNAPDAIPVERSFETSEEGEKTSFA